jgi:DNA-binding transcriptional LysR family regulator
MELRQLRYFVAVVEAGGLRAAASSVHITPSALSRSLDALEQQLGVDLLRRSPYGVELTPAGRDLLGHARVILAQAELATAAMHQHTRAIGLRIGAVQGELAASELTLPILRGFRQAHPALELKATTLPIGDELEALLTDQVDAALVRGPITHPDLEIVPLAYEPRVLLVGADHDLAGEPAVHVGDILGERTIRLAAPEAWSRFWQLDDLRGRPNYLPGLPPARSVIEMHRTVLTGRAIISTSGAVGRLTPTPHTRCIALRGAEPSTIAVASRRRDRRAHVQAFIRHAVHTAHTRIELVPGGTPA